MSLETVKKVTAPLLRAAKGTTKITALTAYDFQTARVLDEAGVDILLVGDSLAMAFAGETSTLRVTLTQMIYHSRIVARAARRAMVVTDMPFGAYNFDAPHKATKNAMRIVKEGMAEAVKIEGGERARREIETIVRAEIPVLAHIGLTPQSIHRMGGYKRQKERDLLLADAKAVEEAGAFAVVLEAVDNDIAKEITQTLSIPAIGIGSGSDVDGQVLVINDLIGFFDGASPPFAPQYAHVRRTVKKAATAYIKNIREEKY